jgi:hypothetical protein
MVNIMFCVPTGVTPDLPELSPLLTQSVTPDAESVTPDPIVSQ